MSPFIWAYVVFVVLVILGINLMFRKSKRSTGQVDDSPDLTRSRSRRRSRKETSPETKVDEPVIQAASINEEPLRSATEETETQAESIDLEESEMPVIEEEPNLTEETLSVAKLEEDTEAVRSTEEPDDRPEKNDKNKKRSKRSEIIDPTSVHPVSIVFVLILGAFTAILNQTLLNVALPKIQTDLNVSYNTVQWLSTGYMLVNGVLIPITAFLIESFTTRVLFIFAMVSFGVGTLFCGVAPSFPILLTGRLIQGIGAGIIMPLMTNVMLTIFPPEKRGAAMGTMGVAMIFAPAVGPTLSGWIVENFSWRILFYVVLPIIVIDVILAYIFLRNVKKLTFPKFDFWGAVLSTIGFGGILYAFSEAGNKGWGSAEVLITLIVGIISLVVFIFRELSIKSPLLEFRVFKYSIFSLTAVVNAVITMAMFAAMILVPIYLQNIRGFTPLKSGLLLLPGAILMGIMSPITGRLYDKIGARPLAIVGLVITAITTWQFASLTDATTYGHIMILYSFRMFGMSMLMMPIMTEGLNNLPPKYYSHGTAMSNTIRQVAGSLGTAFLVTVMTNRSTFHEAGYANALTTSNLYANQHIQGLGQGFAALLHAPVAEGVVTLKDLLYEQVVLESTIKGINDAFVVATGLTVLALILSFFVRRSVPAKSRKTQDAPQQSGPPAPVAKEELATDH